MYDAAEVMACLESLRGRTPPSGMISESDVSPSGERQVEGLFESLLTESFQ
jgi:hypothetical protein